MTPTADWMVNAPIDDDPTSSTRLNAQCRICGHDGLFTTHQIAESMYGTGEYFPYVECPVCGSLSIVKVPNDMFRYYPGDYYSQLPASEPERAHGIKQWLIERSAACRSLHPATRLRAVVSAVLPVPTDYVAVGTYLEKAHLHHQDEGILDVGCGSSPRRLAAMLRCGFRGVEGVDPFLAHDVEYCGIPVRKCTIERVSGTFGLVMFHHSLEHVLDPLADLRVAHRLLRSRGLCIVRVPVVGGFLWRQFGKSWAELDAPRHLQIPSRVGMGMLAQHAGFELEGMQFDSEAWEFEASRQIAAGLPMKLHSIDEQAQERRIDDGILAAKLNVMADAGRACFYLRRH